MMRTWLLAFVGLFLSAVSAAPQPAETSIRWISLSDLARSFGDTVLFTSPGFQWGGMTIYGISSR